MYKFEFDTEQINAILDALGHRPFRSVARLISNIHNQAKPQNVDTIVVKKSKSNGSDSDEISV